MASDPQLIPKPDDPDTVARSAAHDPWGVKRAEKLLMSLQGVLSARVVANPQGEVTEVHVLVQAGTTPKQVVRNVESALLAHLGLKIDHRRISVAQTASVEPIDVLEQAAVQAEAKRRGVLFKRIEVRQGDRQRVTLQVSLTVEGQDVTGEYETADNAKARLQGAARATVMALDKVLPHGTVELEGAILMEAFGLEFAFAGVHVMANRRGTHLLTGSAEVKQSAEEAAALAVLDATNRWLQTQGT